MPRLLLHNATLIDGTSANPRLGISVIAENSRIRCNAPTGGQESGGTGGSRPLVTYRAGGTDDIRIRDKSGGE